MGLGHIAQAAVLPAFKNARRNSVLSALVSDDETKRRVLGRRYGVRTFSYREYEAALEHVDAVYIALPNAMHADFTIRAANRGVHVLCEKPLAVTVAECARMIAACGDAGVKLMTAYRLHFEPVNLRAVEIVQRGRIGEPKILTSMLSMVVAPENYRVERAQGGGTLYDLGIYCIQAARYLFRAEPTQVFASSTSGDRKRLGDVDESTAAILRFDGDRLATFLSSFNASFVAHYHIVGTKGDLRVGSAFEYAEGLSYELSIGGKTQRRKMPRGDQFAPELLYFSDCIRSNREPEPSGREGLQDVRIIQALYESASSGKPVDLPPYTDAKYPSRAQEIRRPPVREPKLVKARPPFVR